MKLCKLEELENLYKKLKQATTENLTSDKNAAFKLVLINNNKMVLTKNNNYEPLHYEGFKGYKILDPDNPNKTKEQLERSLYKSFNKHMYYAFDDYCALDVSLTIDLRLLQLDIFNLIKHMDKRLGYFTRCIRKFSTTDNPFYYVGRYEGNDNDNLIHFHLGIFFKNCIPKELTHGWLTKTWKFGHVWISKHNRASTVLGYLSKTTKKDLIDDTYTKFPSWMKVVRHSINIPTTTNVISGYVSYEGYREIYNILNQINKLLTGQYLVNHQHYGKYINPSTGEVHRCLLRMYMY